MDMGNFNERGLAAHGDSMKHIHLVVRIITFNKKGKSREPEAT
uniref:Uncharacterized protein n=1 Tax=Rhizophora mucronata TaxID=61149 RepID=A0A2P2IHG0_RHIMU